MAESGRSALKGWGVETDVAPERSQADSDDVHYIGTLLPTKARGRGWQSTVLES